MFMCACVYVRVCVCVWLCGCVCVCVCERERKRERQRKRDRERNFRVGASVAESTGLTPTEGHASPVGWSYAPRNCPTVGPYGRAWPYSRVTLQGPTVGLFLWCVSCYSGLLAHCVADPRDPLLRSDRTKGFAAGPVHGMARCSPMLGAFIT